MRFYCNIFLFFNLKCHSRVPSVSSLEKIVHFTERPAHHKNTTSMNNGLHRSTENLSKPTSNHNSYCLNIHMNTIKFSDSKSDVKNIEFRYIIFCLNRQN